MKESKYLMPDFLFDVCWDICNKESETQEEIVKHSLALAKEFKRNHIHIGPDVLMDSDKNPYFTEDLRLFASWKEKVASDGLRVRVGRWNAQGESLVFLVDFSHFIPNKDEILTKMWMEYGVDSLNGSWEYIESLLFGYAAGKVVESFVKYYAFPRSKVIVDFNDWQSGGGLLYLHGTKLPIGTILTLHSTVVGTILQEHGEKSTDNPEQVASDYGQISQYSLEKAAAKYADIVSVAYTSLSVESNRYLERSADFSESDAFDIREEYSELVKRLIKSNRQIPDAGHQPYNKIQANRPSWETVLVNRDMPKRLKHLNTLATNLWWCWNQCAIDLFESVDSDLWKKTNGNPLALLDKVSLKRYKELEKNDDFLNRLDGVFAEFSDYMAGKKTRKGPKVAYFCMEYGLDSSLKIYSGGLGILAGDYLKEASDMQVNLTAVGLLYRYGYFTQRFSTYGDQISSYDPQDFTRIPALPVYDQDGKWMKISISLPGRSVYARIWRVEVGRTDLYLLDTDFEDNQQEDRTITHALYGGDWENRLKQELLLGVGGIRALRALGVYCDVYHCNEGHAAFIGFERLNEYINNTNLSFAEALEVVRSSALFTTHTPVPAGHDAFTEDLLRVYLSYYPARLKTDWKNLMSLGKINADDPNEKFSMSFLAANLSQEINGVSWLHGKVSQQIFSGMWPGYLPEELNVSYVTNGVHYPTWTAPEWKEIHKEVFGPEFQTHHYDKSCFNGIYDVPDAKIWSVRQALRAKLINAVKDIMKDASATAHYSPREIVKICKTLNPDILTIGFARRFATYKRATLLFSNLDRLNDIVNNPERPVQFLFAGKAHPADQAGQDFIKRIIEISKMPQFIGKIVFVPNYDISIAKLLVQGVDVWMNNPTRPLEASGTSGEKAVMNGVMHFSVLDGWWVEGYKEGAGWALQMEQTYEDGHYQDDLDAATIYSIIENEIAPIFYDKKKNGISEEWLSHIRNTVSKVACDFTTNRMMNDYLNQYYIPLSKRKKSLKDKDYAKAREIAVWKKTLRREWNNVEVLSFEKPTNANGSLILGKEFKSSVKISIGDLSPEDIGVELIVVEQNVHGQYNIKDAVTYKCINFDGGIATYEASIYPQLSGMYQMAGRIFAQNPALPHRQDFELVRWL